MKRSYSEEFKKEIIHQYTLGKTANKLSAEHSIPITTIYSWAKLYKTLPATGDKYTLRQIRSLEQSLEKYKSIVKAIHRSSSFRSLTRKEKLDDMEKLYKTAEYSAHVLSDAFLINRSSFLSHLRRAKGSNSMFVLRHNRICSYITEIYAKSHSTYGAERIHASLVEDYNEKSVSITYVRKLMHELGIQGAKQKSTKRINGAARRQRAKKQNLLLQNFTANYPNEIWVSDCKRIYFKDRARTLCVILDLYSRRVIAHKFGKSESTQLITATIKSAIRSRNVQPGLILHTDRGSAYKSFSVNKLLREHKIFHSYSEGGNPEDNGPAEAFFSRLSAEEISPSYCTESYTSERKVYQRINAYIDFFNNVRKHTYNEGYKNPVALENEYYHRNKIAPDKSPTGRQILNRLKCIDEIKHLLRLNYRSYKEDCSASENDIVVLVDSYEHLVA